MTLLRTVSTPAIYRLLTAGVLVALTVPRMVQTGMFSDGVLYAALSRNLSIGVGRMWAPSFSETTYAEFFEHPPLGLWLQATAFLALGDHPAVERGHSLLMFALHALVIARIWRRLLLPAAYDWLPVLFWVLPSVVTWAAINNMLENTQSLFASVAIWLLLVAAQAKQVGKACACAAVAGLAIVAALLTKGPVGLFPLAAPALLLLPPSTRRPRRLMGTVAMMLIAIAACAAALASHESARRGIAEYLRVQLIPLLQGERGLSPTVVTPFEHLLLGIIARMAGLAGLLRMAGWRRAMAGARGAPRTTTLCLFGIAVSASLPTVFSPKVVGHYFLPSVAFFALGFASLALGSVSALAGLPWRRTVPLVTAAVLATATILVPLWLGPVEPRDTSMLRSLDLVARALPRGLTVGACQRSAHQWGLLAYLNRLYRISLDARDLPVNGWFLLEAEACPIPAGCRPVAGGDALALFQCTDRGANVAPRCTRPPSASFPYRPTILRCEREHASSISSVQPPAAAVAAGQFMSRTRRVSHRAIRQRRPTLYAK